MFPALSPKLPPATTKTDYKLSISPFALTTSIAIEMVCHFYLNKVNVTNPFFCAFSKVLSLTRQRLAEKNSPITGILQTDRN